MKAIVVSQDPIQPPLSWLDWPDPIVRPGWVVVELVAAALNRHDAMNVEDRTTRKSPSVIGSDGRYLSSPVGADD